MGGDPPVASTMLHVLSAAVGIPLLLGLWTQMAGSLLAILASCNIFPHPTDALNWTLFGTLVAALALLRLTWGLVGRRLPLRMETDRASGPKGLILTPILRAFPYGKSQYSTPV